MHFMSCYTYVWFLKLKVRREILFLDLTLSLSISEFWIKREISAPCWEWVGLSTASSTSNVKPSDIMHKWLVQNQPNLWSKNQEPSSCFALNQPRRLAGPQQTSPLLTCRGRRRFVSCRHCCPSYSCARRNFCHACGRVCPWESAEISFVAEQDCKPDAISISTCSSWAIWTEFWPPSGRKGF